MFPSESPSQVTTRELRVFALLQLPFLTALLLAWNHWKFPAWSAVPLAVSLIIAVVGGVSPPSIRGIYRIWMAAVGTLGWLVSHLVLAIVYYGVVTPIGWGLRWWSGDPLKLDFDRNAESYWERRPSDKAPSSYFRQF